MTYTRMKSQQSEKKTTPRIERWERKWRGELRNSTPNEKKNEKRNQQQPMNENILVNLVKLVMTWANTRCEHSSPFLFHFPSSDLFLFLRLLTYFRTMVIVVVVFCHLVMFVIEKDDTIEWQSKKKIYSKIGITFAAFVIFGIRTKWMELLAQCGEHRARGEIIVCVNKMSEVICCGADEWWLRTSSPKNYSFACAVVDAWKQDLAH